MEHDVSACQLDDQGVHQIFKALEKNKQLEHIDLVENDISD